MSNAANPVQTAAAAQRKDNVFYGRTNMRMALRDLGDGTYAQVIVNFLDPISAQVQLDSRAALTAALQANTAELTEQNDLQAASNEHTSELGGAVVTLNNSILAGNTLQTARNGMATTTNTRLQTLIDSNGTVNASVQQVVAALAGNLKVTGTFWQATQPVSLASLPLPTGAASETTLAAILGKLSAPLAVTGTFWPTTQPISAASLPLPAGAATDATLITKLDILHTDLAALKDAPETPYFVSFTASGASDLTVNQSAGATRITSVLLSAATGLLGSLLGSTVAEITFFHTDTTTRVFSATSTANATILGAVSVAQGESVPYGLRLDVPAGRFLRAHTTAGGVKMTTTLRAL